MFLLCFVRYRARACGYGGKSRLPFEKLRAKNIGEAKSIFEDFMAIIESGLVPWVWQKKRKDRTTLVLSVMSFLRLLRNEYVFFNPRYLRDAVDVWKTLAKNHPEVEKRIRIYEERLKLKGKIGEIGERMVDLSSSLYLVPVCFSMALEYEAEPDWGSIMVDFRKLLSVLAPVKVGIFHLPAWWKKSQVWLQNEKTGEIKFVDKVLDSDKLEQFVEDVIREIKRNALEHPYSVYLIILVHAQTENKEVNVHGYLFWREATGEVKLEKLQTKKFRS